MRPFVPLSVVLSVITMLLVEAAAACEWSDASEGKELTVRQRGRPGRIKQTIVPLAVVPSVSATLATRLPPRT